MLMPSLFFYFCYTTNDVSFSLLCLLFIVLNCLSILFIISIKKKYFNLLLYFHHFGTSPMFLLFVLLTLHCTLSSYSIEIIIFIYSSASHYYYFITYSSVVVLHYYIIYLLQQTANVMMHICHRSLENLHQDRRCPRTKHTKIDVRNGVAARQCC